MSDVRKAINELQRLMEPDGGAEIPKAPLPELDEVLYVGPVLGGERRNCSNCILWAGKDRCSIMEGSVEATADHVCGYHIYGSPGEPGKNWKGLQPVDPKLAGLTLVKGGTSCDKCEHFIPNDEEDGVCTATVKRKRPAHVHPKGCCTRWTRKEPLTDPKAP